MMYCPCNRKRYKNGCRTEILHYLYTTKIYKTKGEIKMTTKKSYLDKVKQLYTQTINNVNELTKDEKSITSQAVVNTIANTYCPKGVSVPVNVIDNSSYFVFAIDIPTMIWEITEHNTKDVGELISDFDFLDAVKDYLYVCVSKKQIRDRVQLYNSSVKKYSK